MLQDLSIEEKNIYWVTAKINQREKYTIFLPTKIAKYDQISISEKKSPQKLISQKLIFAKMYLFMNNLRVKLFFFTNTATTFTACNIRNHERNTNETDIRLKINIKNMIPMSNSFHLPKVTKERKKCFTKVCVIYKS